MILHDGVLGSRRQQKYVVDLFNFFREVQEVRGALEIPGALQSLNYVAVDEQRCAFDEQM